MAYRFDIITELVDIVFPIWINVSAKKFPTKISSMSVAQVRNSLYVVGGWNGTTNFDKRPIKTTLTKSLTITQWIKDFAISPD